MHEYFVNVIAVSPYNWTYQHALALWFTIINILENTSGVPAVTWGNPNNPNEDNTTVRDIIKQHENHISIINIKNHYGGRDGP